MTNLKIPVPPGFTLTTNLCMDYLNDGVYPDELENEVQNAIEKVEKAELRTSRSLIEEITSLEHIEEARLPSIVLNHLNCNIRTVLLCDDELILYDSKASINIVSMK